MSIKYVKCALLVMIVLFSARSGFASDIYVAPSGADTASGEQDYPLATLGAAILKAREIRKNAPQERMTIRLVPGEYSIAETITLAAEDSGSAEAPLVIEGMLIDGKCPTLAGGIRVENWEKASNESRFPEGTMVADLTPLGGDKKLHQIYDRGIRQIWARWPNYEPNLPYSGGWAYVEGKRVPMYGDIPGEPRDVVTLCEADRREWASPNDGEVCIFPRYNWWNRIEKIKSYDKASGKITLEKEMMYAARPMDRFAVFGMREELDAPGEWWQDIPNKKLYFLPVDNSSKYEVTIPTVDYVIKIEKAKNIIIRNVEISCAENGAIRVTDSENCVIEKSRIHDLGYMAGGGIGVFGGRNVTIKGCNIWNIGGHGVEAYAGDILNMVKCGHKIDNCYIHHVGQFNRHGIGVIAGGCGVTVSHTLIHDTPRCGLFHSGVFHTFEFNRIRHCNTEMEDTGATYGGGWTGGWTTIRYNHCSNSIGFNNHGKFNVFAWGIYLDEGGRGCDVYGNIVEHCQVGAMHLHCACDNHIWNNIFVSDAGPEGKTHQFSLQGWTNDPKGYFVKSRREPMMKEYEQRTKNPEWKKQRGMDYSPENPYLPDGNVMRGNLIEKNIFYYPDQPDSRYMSVHNVNFESNKIDYNLLWNGGEKPISTGVSHVEGGGADKTGLIPNAQFNEPVSPNEKNENKTAASGWFWYHKTFPEMRSEIVDFCGGKGLLIGAAYNPEKKYIRTSCVRSNAFPIEKGKDYALSFDLKTTDADAGLTARLVTENQGLWKAFGSKTFSAKDGETVHCETSFHYPAEGEADGDPRLGKVDVQFEFNAHQGEAVVGNLQFREARRLSEWESWQIDGADVHSIVADPLFENPSKENWRLRPDSPALKLGFEQIPFEKIGPYQDDARAEWPIQEAEGVREHPEWLTSVMVEHE